MTSLIRRTTGRQLAALRQVFFERSFRRRRARPRSLGPAEVKWRRPAFPYQPALSAGSADAADWTRFP